MELTDFGRLPCGICRWRRIAFHSISLGSARDRPSQVFSSLKMFLAMESETNATRQTTENRQFSSSLVFTYKMCVVDGTLSVLITSISNVYL